MFRFPYVRAVLTTIIREGRSAGEGMSQKQKSLTSFFSTKSPGAATSTSPFSQFKKTSPVTKTPDKPESGKSPTNVLKEKPATKNCKVKSPKKKAPPPKRNKTEASVDSAVRDVKKVRISEEVVAMGTKNADDSSSPSSSPIKANKRRRVQVLESDESASDTENMATLPTATPSPKAQSKDTPSPHKARSVTPKRKTAKLSKEFRSKLANRVQTPHVNKLNSCIKEDVSSPEESSPPKSSPKPSPVMSTKLASFTYKKRATTEQSPTKFGSFTKKASVSPAKEQSEKIEDVKMETSPVKQQTESDKVEWVDNGSSSETEEAVQVTKSKPTAVKNTTKSPATKSHATKRKTKPPAVKKATKTTPAPTKNSTLKPEPKNDAKTTENEKEDSSKDAGKGMTLVSAVADGGYKPGRTGYKPIADACWKAGQDVPYKALSDTLKAIEGTSARLRKTAILSNFLRSVGILTPDDLHLCVYLCTNQLAPAYKGIELGVGETVVMRAIGEACGTNTVELRAKLVKLGDLGLVAEASRAKQKMMFKPKPLTVKSVFSTLLQITAISGTKGQGQKVDLIKKLLVSCQGSEARFITRSILGKLRCGLAEQTVLVSIGHATLLTPPGGETENAVGSKNTEKRLAEAALLVKTCFCEFPDYDHLIAMIREHGVLKCQEHCKLSPGVPVKPMLAHPTKGISEVLQRFEGAQFTCEFKYDGERAQIQCSGAGNMSIFSRNQENNTTKYPDIISRMGSCLAEGTESFILDCEVVAWDVEREHILPFQILTTRKRKDADIDEIKVQVCLFAFDLLYLNGESLVREPFRRRRELLHTAFQEVKGEFIFATAKDCNDTEEIQEFLEESIKRQCEGLMVKTLDIDATYEISRRSRNWLKVKKDYLEGVGDSLDLTVIGAYQGKGKRSGAYGGFLLACYDVDTEQFQAICKIGTGFTDEDLTAHHAALSEHLITEPKPYYSYPETNAPDVWFEPSLVWEVKCADMTISPIYTAAVGLVDPEKGISLRFPRFIRIRDDKSAEDGTSAEQVAELYNKQDNKQEQTKTEDDGYDDYM